MTIPPDVLTEMGRQVPRDQAPQAQTQQVAVACNAFCWLFGAIAGLTCDRPQGHKGKHKRTVTTANPTGEFTVTWTQLT